MAYKKYLLVVLAAILASHYLDRIVLGVVLQDVQVSLNLTDTQLGFLTGIGFTILYSFMGIPLARWADRGNRVLIISITVMLWSLAVVISTFARTYLELLLIRMGAAAAQAGCMPAAYSLLGDNFTRAERPRAAANYMLGLPVALIIGYFAGGFLNDLYGWRLTFAIMSVPGIALGALAALTLKEPRRGLRAPAGAEVSERERPAASGPSLRVAAAALFGNATFRQLCLFVSIWYFFSYPLLYWQPAFFIRIHHVETASVGMWLALIYGGGALLGTYLGGVWSARYAANNERLQLVGVIFMFSAFAVFAGAAYLVSDTNLAFALIALGTIVGNMSQGPILGTIQTFVPSHMRAMSLALLYLIGNLLGMGLGPLAVGIMSDALKPWVADESLRYALFICCPGHLWAAWHLWRARRTILVKIVVDRES